MEEDTTETLVSIPAASKNLLIEASSNAEDNRSIKSPEDPGSLIADFQHQDTVASHQRNKQMLTPS